MRGADLSNGFINRFVVLSTDNRAPSQEPEHELRAVPEDIAAKAKELYERRSVRGNLAMMHDADVPVEPEIHGWADGAARLLYNSFTSYVHKRIDKEPGFEAFAGRWPENAVRIATIRAAGHGWPDFTITYDDMLWAINVVRACGERLIDQAGTHRVEEELSHPAAHAKIVQILKESGGNMTRSALLRKVQRQVKSKDLDGIIKQLAESETIIAVPRSGISPACYKLAGNA